MTPTEGVQPVSAPAQPRDVAPICPALSAGSRAVEGDPRSRAPAGAVEPWIAPTEIAGANWFRRVTEAESAPGTRPETGTLPYGADPRRIRELVEWMVSGREPVPLVLQSREAGDPLRPGPVPAKPFVSVREVAAVYKAC